MDQIASITIKREPGYWTEHRVKSYQQNQRHHGQKGDSEVAFPTSIHSSHGPVNIWQMTENSEVGQACLHTASALLCTDSCLILHTDNINHLRGVCGKTVNKKWINLPRLSSKLRTLWVRNLNQGCSPNWSNKPTKGIKVSMIISWQGPDCPLLVIMIFLEYRVLNCESQLHLGHRTTCGRSWRI